MTFPPLKKIALLGITFAALLGSTRVFGADAVENWGKFCASCHGKDGAGHTKAGRLVKTKDLTDAQYQKSFTDADAIKAINDGIQDKDGNTKMKPLKDKVSAEEATALVAYVRTLAK